MNLKERRLRRLNGFMLEISCIFIFLVTTLLFPGHPLCSNALPSGPQTLETIRAGRHGDYSSVVFDFGNQFQFDKPVIKDGEVRFRLINVKTTLSTYHEYKNSESWVRLEQAENDINVRVGLLQRVTRFHSSVLTNPDRLAIHLYWEKTKSAATPEKQADPKLPSVPTPAVAEEQKVSTEIPQGKETPSPQTVPQEKRINPTQPPGSKSTGHGQAAIDPSPQKRLLTLNFFQDDIKEILSGLAVQQKINIVTSKDVSGEVSVHLYQVTFDSALQAICRAGGFSYLKKENIYYVFKPKADEENKSDPKKLELKIFKLEYADMNKIQGVLDAIPGIRMVKIHAPSKSIIVEDTPENIAKIETLIRFWDTRPKQVLIEAKILEILLTDDMALGVNWDKILGDVRIGTGGFSRAILPGQEEGISPVPGTDEGLFANIITGAGTSYQFAAALDALRTKTKINTLSTPKITAIDGKLAKVQVGGKQGYAVTTVNQGISTESIEFIDTGTILEIKPYIDHENNILLELKPSLNSATIEQGIPVVRSTNVTTWVMAKNGETVFIGGLIEDKSVNTRTGIPCLMNIPGLNLLFGRSSKGTEKSELVVLITPRVLEFGTSRDEEALRKTGEAEKYFKSMPSSPSTLLNPLPAHK